MSAPPARIWPVLTSVDCAVRFAEAEDTRHEHECAQIPLIDRMLSRLRERAVGSCLQFDGRYDGLAAPPTQRGTSPGQAPIMFGVAHQPKADGHSGSGVEVIRRAKLAHDDEWRNELVPITQ